MPEQNQAKHRLRVQSHFASVRLSGCEAFPIFAQSRRSSGRSSHSNHRPFVEANHCSRSNRESVRRNPIARQAEPAQSHHDTRPSSESRSAGGSPPRWRPPDVFPGALSPHRSLRLHGGGRTCRGTRGARGRQIDPAVSAGSAVADISDTATRCAARRSDWSRATCAQQLMMAVRSADALAADIPHAWRLTPEAYLKRTSV